MKKENVMFISNSDYNMYGCPNCGFISEKIDDKVLKLSLTCPECGFKIKTISEKESKEWAEFLKAKNEILTRNLEEIEKDDVTINHYFNKLQNACGFVQCEKVLDSIYDLYKSKAQDVFELYLNGSIDYFKLISLEIKEPEREINDLIDKNENLTDKQINKIKYFCFLMGDIIIYLCISKLYKENEIEKDRATIRNIEQFTIITSHPRIGIPGHNDLPDIKPENGDYVTPRCLGLTCDDETIYYIKSKYAGNRIKKIFRDVSKEFELAGKPFCFYSFWVDYREWERAYIQFKFKSKSTEAAEKLIDLTIDNNNVITKELVRQANEYAISFNDQGIKRSIKKTKENC